MIEKPSTKIRMIPALLAFLCIPVYQEGTASEEVSLPLSEESEACIDCHAIVSPGIVADWKTSRHARITVAQALEETALARRVSATDVPESLQKVAVGCFECHGLHSEDRPDSFDHFDFQISSIVSPRDCAACHPTEVREYSGSKKAHAYGNLLNNPLYTTLVDTITEVKEVDLGGIHGLGASDNARGESCLACHGTEVRVEGTREITTDYGDIEVPVLTNWPNQGVGRVNPDGSLGACTACHPRHSFSLEVARKPYTCRQCHLQPDVPAFDVYMESKHGNIFSSLGDSWNWEAVPWVPGRDFTAPTCATCHNSLLATEEGDVLVERTHDFGERLWVRIFGLIYSHPQPKDGRTFLIENPQGQPLPTTFNGEIASEFLISATEQALRRMEMLKVCTSCHSTSWSRAQIEKLDTTNRETDAMTQAATRLIQRAWNEGLADPTNPFDEALELKWVKQWLFYANSVRYGQAMMGPDYAGFKNGWWSLHENLQELHDAIEIKRSLKRGVDQPEEGP